MKIAVFVGAFPTVSETFIVAQIRGMLQRGHDVRIIAESSGELNVVHDDVRAWSMLDRVSYVQDFFSMTTDRRVRVSAGQRLRRTAKALWRRANYLLPTRGEDYSREQRQAYCRALGGDCAFDVIHCHFGILGRKVVALRQAGHLQGPILTSFHGVDVGRYPRERGAGVYGPLFRLGDMFTANSFYTRQRLLDLGCETGKVEVLRCGIDLDRFPFSSREDRSDSQLEVLSIGRLVEKKGFAYALEAMAVVMRERPGVRYRIVGDGPLREELQVRAQALGIRERTDFLGWRASREVREFYHRADVFLLPSVTGADGDVEGQGVVLQEAQATGLPIVATTHNGFPEGVRDGASGFLVGERDAAALVEPILRLIDNKELRRTMGSAGRLFVEERFDINALNDDLVGLYLDLSAGSRRDY